MIAEIYIFSRGGLSTGKRERKSRQTEGTTAADNIVYNFVIVERAVMDLVKLGEIRQSRGLENFVTDLENKITYYKHSNWGGKLSSSFRILKKAKHERCIIHTCCKVSRIVAVLKVIFDLHYFRSVWPV
jgi:hypothetical protein